MQKLDTEAESLVYALKARGYTTLVAAAGKKQVDLHLRLIAERGYARDRDLLAKLAAVLAIP